MQRTTNKKKRTGKKNKGMRSNHRSGNIVRSRELCYFELKGNKYERITEHMHELPLFFVC